MEDPPIIHAGISNSNCDRAGNTIRQFIKWEKIAKGREKKTGKRDSSSLFRLWLVFFFSALKTHFYFPYFYLGGRFVLVFFFFFNMIMMYFSTFMPFLLTLVYWNIFFQL